MEALVVRKSEFGEIEGVKYYPTERSDGYAVQWLWFHRTDALYVMDSGWIQGISNDIFLEDYFSDIDNPTSIELTLLELQHNIRYVKD